MEEIPEGYTRVSEILSIFQAYSFVPRATLKKAQEVGTDIHAAIESYLKGEFVTLSPKLEPYLDSFIKWHTGKKLTIRHQEERFFDHTLKITGRLDLVTDINGGWETCRIIDFKTGSWAHPELWRLQAEAYRYLMYLHYIETKQEFWPCPRLMVIHIQKDGSDPVIYQWEHDPDVLNIFLKAIDCHRYLKSGLTLISP